MTKNQNAFETTLTAQFGASDLVANVVELGTLTSPCYVVIEPDSDTQREVILFDGVFGATSFVTSTTNNRYLPGSAAPSGLTHPAGATVRSVILAQHLDDLDTRIDSLDHADLGGLTSGDPHTQYVLESDHTTSGSHDALAINADKLQGSEPSDFAPNTHVGTSSTSTGHPLVTTGSAGFMSALDKTNLDALVNTPGGVNSVSAGSGIDVTGTSAVTVSHEDTSTASSINNGPAEHIDVISVDGFGHVTSMTKQTMSAADIGAASTTQLTTHKTSSDHDSRYYTEDEINTFLNAKLNQTNPDFDGVLQASGTNVLDNAAGFTKLYQGALPVLSGDGFDELYLVGVPYSAAQFHVRCTEETEGRRLYYYDDSSTKRFKHDIRDSELDGTEVLKWQGARFKKNVEGDDGPDHEWFIAEQVYEISGEDFIVREASGEIINTDDRAMLLDTIIALQKAVSEIELLKQRIHDLESKP